MTPQTNASIDARTATALERIADSLERTQRIQEVQELRLDRGRPRSSRQFHLRELERELWPDE